MSMQDIKNVLSSSRNVALLSAVSAIGVAAGYQLWRSSKLKIPGTFVEVGYVKKIFIFPIKSLPGLEVSSAYLTDTGLTYGPLVDRAFMLQKEDTGIMISMRQEPSLALLKLSFSGTCILLDGQGMGTLQIPLKTSVGKGDVVRTCRLYGQDIQGIDCGDEIAQWFQKYLGKPGFRLLQFVPNFQPRKLVNNLLNHFNPGKMVYHDDCTYLVLSEASVTDLNSRMKGEQISHRNFRPNFLLSGCDAFAEDKMKYAKVGEAILLQTIPCPRCILTTVNPETGIKTEKEPLTTLRTYRMTENEELKRKFPNSPMFGVYMGIRKEGTVTVGDPVYGIPF